MITEFGKQFVFGGKGKNFNAHCATLRGRKTAQKQGSPVMDGGWPFWLGLPFCLIDCFLGKLFKQRKQSKN